jgi:protoporphyrinogen oxidase
LKNETLILGGGLAGMSAAQALGSAYTLLEQEPELGGLCRTRWVDGFGFDRAIHVLYTKHEHLAEKICRQFLDGRFYAHQRSAWVYARGHARPYPFHAHLHGLPPNVVDDCLRGLKNVKDDTSLPVPENLSDWIRATFGDGIAEHFMLPYNRKVWATRPEDMSPDWIADRVPPLCAAEVEEGAATPRHLSRGPNAEFWYPSHGGIQALSDGIQRYLDMDRVYLRAQVVGVDHRNRTVRLLDGTLLSYTRLISSLPLPALIRLLDPVPGHVARSASRLKWNSVCTVMIGFERALEIPYHWVYFAEPEFVFHRVSLPTNFSPAMAPPGCGSVMAEISIPGGTSVDRDALLEETKRGLFRCGLLRTTDVIRVEATEVLCPAYVIYDADRCNAVRSIREWLECQAGIALAGRFGEWEYFNMDQAIASGVDAAMAVAGSVHSYGAGARSPHSSAGI